MKNDETYISEISDYELIKNIRNKILRPQQDISSCIFPNDINSIHLGCYKRDKLVSIISFFKKNLKGYEKFNCWQFRGMATITNHERLGYGKKLLKASIKIVKSNGADYFWCNARESALNFYKKLNFKIISERFIIPVSGPHYKMILNTKNDKM
tara:strand:+ start:149 stop:610 length:462 start_codon:yes stop_codon:yes gene_type:complete